MKANEYRNKIRLILIFIKKILGPNFFNFKAESETFCN